MKKLKIVGMSSEEYPGGRLDSFTIELPNESPHHSHIIPLFLELGFPKEETLEKLDIIFSEIDYLFIYGSVNIKAHFIINDETLSIKFDTNIQKEKINEIVEKYFQFPE